MSSTLQKKGCIYVTISAIWFKISYDKRIAEWLRMLKVIQLTLYTILCTKKRMPVKLKGKEKLPTAEFHDQRVLNPHFLEVSTP